jgi:hypothetical protein
MPIDSTSPRVIDWLAQFELEDQPIAARMLSEVLIVDANELVAGLRALILGIAEKALGPLALYTERHIRRQHGIPDRLFTESRRSPRRAFGNGPAPVPAGRPYARETGSEGLIATLITGLVRSKPDLFLDHPGPDQIRSRKVRQYVVVTDFIGSGHRARDNLEAAWKVASFKSWHSYGLLRFTVAAYSGTSQGVRLAEAHRSRPSIQLRRGCPTVNELESPMRGKVLDLCSRYGPKPKSDDWTALGYGGSGALIAFDHGMPNNAPLMFHIKTRRWVPLFPSRSASLLTEAKRTSARADEIDRALKRLREKRLASAHRFVGMLEYDQERILLLTALKRRPRTPLALSARTGLTLAEVQALIRQAQEHGHVDARLRLTPAAFETLHYLKTVDSSRPSLPETNEAPYCPLSLRSPRKVV